MKKKMKIISLVIASIVVLCVIFGVIDYNRAMNGKKPIFTVKGVSISSFDVYVADEMQNYSEVNNSDNSHQFQEYIGLGYKVLLCEVNCDNGAHFMLFGEDTYDFFTSTYSPEDNID